MLILLTYIDKITGQTIKVIYTVKPQLKSTNKHSKKTRKRTDR